ncbi:dipeptidase [Acetonema longum]|uniref:Membrane dipeptidase n=1 Tax=Acetonema longum DSM 6540 TaxID=1009370 RepID=F7NMC5_9FIRM|nr:dipeptidase [Acetonema longum]EGO62801.1 membrane dipeptidase [Acetonema longum DSM 6540]
MHIIDWHCDTILKLWRSEGKAALSENHLSIDLEKLQAGHSLAQFFAVFIDLESHPQPFTAFNAMADLFQQELAQNSGRIALARSVAELKANRDSGYISAFLTIEDGGVLEGQMENLYQAYERGVRLITLTWNYPNEIGYPNHEWTHQNQGLTGFGREVAAEMNRLGMIVDVSHLSDQGFYDVAQLSSRPFVASHSNARSITGHSRNLTDEMIRLLAEKGGITGLNFCHAFLGEDPATSRIEDMVRHIRHIVNAGGIEVMALGTDFDGISSSQLEIEHMGEIDKLVQALEQSGFTSGEIEKICWRNAWRVIQDTMM